MRRVIAILLDAADPALVEKWIDDGSLPNLKKMRSDGVYGTVSSNANWIASIPWASLYTGGKPEEVDIPYVLCWNPQKMTTERLASRTALTPFWRQFDSAGPRSIILDMPFSPPPVHFNGIEVSGWMTHDTILEKLETYPASLKAGMLADFQDASRIVERTGKMNAGEFLTTRDSLNRQTKNMEDLAVSLLQREEWDFCMISMNTPHFGGHKLWDLSNVNLSSSDMTDELCDALRQVYAACDASMGKIIASAGEDVHVVAFSVHGMMHNINRSEILPEMLKCILAEHGKPIKSIKRGVMARLREAIPVKWRHQLTSRLPMKLRDRLSSFWHVGQNPWKTTKAFCLPSSLFGLIRINLIGRERLGIVPPEELDLICKTLSDGLKTFVDAETAEPIVKNVRRANLDGGDHQGYPDLVVEWADSPAASHRAIFSPAFGKIPWPTPGENPDGRSGNHRFKGIFFASGPDIKSGTIEEINIIDLLPTLLTLLGEPVQANLPGKAAPILQSQTKR